MWLVLFFRTRYILYVYKAPLPDACDVKPGGWLFWLLVPCELAGLGPLGPPGTPRTGGTQSFRSPGTLWPGETRYFQSLGMSDIAVGRSRNNV